jgi:hypothetical protein
MLSFDSYLQPASSAAPPPPVVHAPVIIDATSPKALQPFLTMVASLETHSNVEVAAAEGRRLSPYFNMLSRYLSEVIMSSAEMNAPAKQRQMKELTKPESLEGIFNAAARRTRNTLTSDVAVLPSNVVRDGPAARLFRDEMQFETPYNHNGHTFNFGFVQVFEGGKKARRSSTTLPVFLLEEKMIDAAAPYGIHGALKNFQAAITHVNHDMLHHFSSPTVNEVIAHKFDDAYSARALHQWMDTVYSGETDRMGNLYETWLKMGHMQAVLRGTDETNALAAKVTRYFDELKRIGAEIAAEDGSSPNQSRGRAHDVVDYFGTVMGHALGRGYPLNHPIMAHCFKCMEAADPAPDMTAAECAEQLGAAKSAENPLAAVRAGAAKSTSIPALLSSYRAAGFDILPDDDAAVTYATFKMLQLMIISRSDVQPQAPNPSSPEMRRLQRQTGELAIKLFEAAARDFGYGSKEPIMTIPAPETAPVPSQQHAVRLKPLAKDTFNKASDPDGRTAFALSNVEASIYELPEDFALAPVAEVLSLLAQPDFAEQSLGTLVTGSQRNYLKSAMETDGEFYSGAAALLTGTARSGLSLHMIAAEGAEGKPVPLILIEDAQRRKCVVIGDEPVSASFSDTLRKAGVTYTARSSPDAGRAIDAFLMEAVSSRTPRITPHQIIEDLIIAMTIVTELPPKFITDAGMIAKGTRPGDLLAASAEMPRLFTSIVKLRQ